MEISLAGRTALVTGASLGLGRAMAEQFARCGARVALLARRPEPLTRARDAIRAAGGQAEAYPCDVAVAAELEVVHEQVVRDLGPVDILVNNAGRASAARFAEITDQMWQEDFDLKVFAAIRLCRLVMPGMRERRWGRILNLLNTYARTPSAGTAPTSVSRAAGLALTKVLAGEGAADNVLVNALMIGLIKSDQIRRGWEASDGSKTFDEFVAEAGRRLPMGRMGEAEECANLATFLVSDQASYVTGCAVNMDGGMSPVP